MKFDVNHFSWDGEYLMYWSFDSGEKHFVARFKRRSDRTGFVHFLRKNFTVEEYFHKLVVEKTPPVTILETKGYVSTTVKKILKEAGYPTTQEGKEKYLKDQAAIRAERFAGKA